LGATQKLGRRGRTKEGGRLRTVKWANLIEEGELKAKRGLWGVMIAGRGKEREYFRWEVRPASDTEEGESTWRVNFDGVTYGSSKGRRTVGKNCHPVGLRQKNGHPLGKGKAKGPRPLMDPSSGRDKGHGEKKSTLRSACT